MSEILIEKAVSKIDRNYNYKIDKEGNLIKERYNIIKDPYSLVTLCVILMGILYYTSIINNPLAVKNIDHTCENLIEVCGKYIALKDIWITNHSGEKINVRDIINTKIEIKVPDNPLKPLNLSSIKYG